MSEELVKNNPKSPDGVFMPTRDEFTDLAKLQTTHENKKNKHYLDRYADLYSEHLVRGKTGTLPFCFITKDAYSNYLPPEYTASKYGAYPTWGPEETGFRTRSHYVAEPVEKFANIDMYRRPFTNQTGRIIFDHGRPNNGYNLQRNQYNNTWFNSSLELNQTDVLKSIQPKTKEEYKSIDNFEKAMTRAKTANWPFCSEYVQKISLQSKN